MFVWIFAERICSCSAYWKETNGLLCPFASFCIYGLWKNSNYTATKSSATIALYRSFAVHWAGNICLPRRFLWAK